MPTVVTSPVGCLSALVVGGTNTSRRTGPQLVLFQCLTLESSGPGSLEVPGMGLGPCGSQLYLGVCPRILYFFSVLWKYGYVTCDIYIK
ncbi:hypothetical protein Taro_054726, partial [Colocasia esculenta]|nr:hypothetical protein [Colocasia esculenta]